MTRALRNTLAAMAAALVAGVATTQARDESVQTPRPTAPPVLVLIGCVERVMPPQPAGNPAVPVPVYKIMDVQPGSGAGQKPMTLAPEYLIVGPESMPFSKYQNQWVELTGSITAPPAVAPPPQSGRGQPPTAPPLPTFTVTALKVVSTECRALTGR